MFGSDKKQVLTVIFCVIALVVGGVFVFRTIKPPTDKATPWIKVWCFDLATGKPFVGTEKDAPPFATASGPLKDGSPAGVRAEVQSCGDCNVEAERFVAWVWKFTPEAQKAVQGAIDALPNGYVEDSPYDLSAARANPDAILYATPDALDAWVTEGSADGQQLMKEAAAHCKGKPAKSCPAQ